MALNSMILFPLFYNIWMLSLWLVTVHSTANDLHYTIVSYIAIYWNSVGENLGEFGWTKIIYQYLKVPFFKGYKFHEWTKKGSLGKLFSWINIGVFSSVCNLCHDRISANFRRNKFCGSAKIHEIRKICSPWKKAPYGILPSQIQMLKHLRYCKFTSFLNRNSEMMESLKFYPARICISYTLLVADYSYVLH